MIVKVSHDDIDWARELRAQHDREHRGNQFESKDRWCGKLGELVFDQMMRSSGFKHNWVAKQECDATADFVIYNTHYGKITVDVKCHAFAKIKPPITAVQLTTMKRGRRRWVKDNQPDWFYLTIYSEVTREVKTFGAVTPDTFRTKAKFFDEKESVRGFFWARNPLFNMWAKYLIPENEWLRALVPTTGRLF